MFLRGRFSQVCGTQSGAKPERLTKVLDMHPRNRSNPEGKNDVDDQEGGIEPQGRVLIVEDEVALADGVARGLLAEGFDVEVIHDGVAGLEKARDESIDVIVLDTPPSRNALDFLDAPDRLTAVFVRR